MVMSGSSADQGDCSLASPPEDNLAAEVLAEAGFRTELVLQCLEVASDDLLDISICWNVPKAALSDSFTSSSVA